MLKNPDFLSLKLKVPEGGNRQKDVGKHSLDYLFAIFCLSEALARESISLILW
jgi:hypothetical protein